MAKRTEKILSTQIKVALSQIDKVSVLSNPSGNCECKGIYGFGAGGTGTPDLIVVADGKFIGMELKAGTKQSASQIAFEGRLKSREHPWHVYVVVSSIEEAVRVVREVLDGR